MELMQSAPTVGERIGHYRNSTPRFIKLVGVGDGGGRIANTVADCGLPNVDVSSGVIPVAWNEVIHGAVQSHANMVVIVCAEGDEALLKPEPTNPSILVTFVLLQPGAGSGARQAAVAEARACSDLFVTTSDVDYVPELIANLAS